MSRKKIEKSAEPEGVPEPDADGKAPCFNCKKKVELSEAECSGCNSVVCSACDKSIGLFGSHKREQHLEYGDDG